MKKEDREVLAEKCSGALDTIHAVWIQVVALAPDDHTMQATVKAAWDQVGHLAHALISEPDKADDGGRRCSFCGSRTEIPF